MMDSETELVCIKETNEIKQVWDKEIIFENLIYYMKDGTSYHESQISTLSEDFIKAYVERLVKNKQLFLDKLDEIIRYDSRKH